MVLLIKKLLKYKNNENLTYIAISSCEVCVTQAGVVVNFINAASAYTQMGCAIVYVCNLS